MKKRHDLWKYLCSAVICLVYLCPIYVLVVMSFKTVTDRTGRLVLPEIWHWENYVKVFLESGLLRSLRNTCIITAVTVASEVIVSCMAAYPLARNKTKLNKFIRMLIMGVMMIPSLSILVGVYSTLVSLHAISTYWGIIIVSVAFGLPLPIFLYTNFMSAIPQALDEASAIDGCNALQTFFLIILPQLKPVTVSIIILNGVSMWNEYGYALYILQKPQMYTLPLMISQYFSASSVSDLNGAAAAAVIAIAPLILAYLFLQKYFIQGQMESALKG